MARRLLGGAAEIIILSTRSPFADVMRAGLNGFRLAPAQRSRVAQTATPERHDERAHAYTLAAWTSARAVPVHRCPTISDTASAGGPRRAAPYRVVLPRAEIIPAPLLGIPRLPTINAHYALLPRCPDMNRAAWSIQHHNLVGLNVHSLDARINTGGTLAHGYVRVNPRNALAAIRTKQKRLAADPVPPVATVIANARAGPIPHPAKKDTQYYPMHPTLRRALERKVGTSAHRSLRAVHAAEAASAWLRPPARANARL